MAARPDSVPASLQHCSVCGWTDIRTDDCGHVDEVDVQPLPAQGSVVAMTAVEGTAFVAVALACGVTALAVADEFPLREAIVDLTPRADGSLGVIRL